MSEELAVNMATLEAPATSVVETPEIHSEVTKDLNPSVTEPEVKVEEPALQDDNLSKSKQLRHDKKVAALNRKIGEQQARADMLQRQLEEAKPKPEAVKSGLKLADYDYDEDRFAEAVAKEAESKAVKRYNDEQQAQTHKQTMQRLEKDWDVKASKADGKYDDFDEIVGELKPTSHLNIAIMQAENGDDIAYYLGKNLDEAKRIANLDPVAAIREIGRLEAKLLTEPPKIKEPSKAPAPIVPLNGKASSVSDMPSDSDDMATWIRKERAREAKARA